MPTTWRSRACLAHFAKPREKPPRIQEQGLRHVFSTLGAIVGSPFRLGRCRSRGLERHWKSDNPCPIDESPLHSRNSGGGGGARASSRAGTNRQLNVSQHSAVPRQSASLLRCHTGHQRTEHDSRLAGTTPCPSSLLIRTRLRAYVARQGTRRASHSRDGTSHETRRLSTTLVR